LTLEEVRALNGRTYSPAVDSRGTALSGFEDWSQTVAVQSVSPDKVTLNIVDSDPDAVRVTVTALQRGQRVADVQWYRFRPMP
jgi:hypothetical protein